MKVTVVLWIPNPFLLQVTKKNQTFSKCHCKTSEIWPKISIKENLWKRTVRRKAVLLWEKKLSSYFLFFWKILNTFLSANAKLVKFGLKSALKKICEKELSEGKLFCFRKEAVKLFLSAKAVMVLRSHQKIVKFDGAKLFYAATFFK